MVFRSLQCWDDQIPSQPETLMARMFLWELLVQGQDKSHLGEDLLMLPLHIRLNRALDLLSHHLTRAVVVRIIQAMAQEWNPKQSIWMRLPMTKTMGFSIPHRGDQSPVWEATPVMILIPVKLTLQQGLPHPAECWVQ